ncbi:MAG: hypothetical protein ABI688_09540 [Bacteroidota bacterium]
MALLCFTVVFFCYSFPKAAGFTRSRKLIVQSSGIAAMIIALFLSTRFHDIIKNLWGLFGIVALIGIFIGLYKLRWSILFWLGVINGIPVVLNKVFYHTESLFHYLAVLQKISFASFLLWMSCISIRIYRDRSS